MTALKYKFNNNEIRIKLRKEVKPFTWLCARLAHYELLLDQGLGIRWSIPLLLCAILGHITVGAGEEFGSILLHIRVGCLGL